MARSCLALLGIVLALALPAGARAHGGPPVVENLSFDPSDPMHVLAGTNFGTMVSHDRGATWSWICPGVVQLRPAVEDPLVVVSDQGSLFVGDTAGIWRGSADACDWSSSVAIPGTATGGAIARGGPGVLFAGTSTDGGSNALLRSTTDGATWDIVLGPTLDVWFESVMVAPSDPQRVYAVQNRPPLRAEPWEVTVWRSDDGGDHWTSAPFTVLTHEWRLFLLGIDPTSPDRILAYTQDLYPMEHERVMLSEDGGTTWTDVLELRQVLGGSWGPDGAAYVAGPLDGLWRSDDGARTFTGIRTDLFLRCVVADADAVWVCADDYTAHFAVGRSVDHGATFETVSRLRSITGQPTCAPTSSLGMTCPAEQGTLDMVLATAPIDVDAGVVYDAAVPAEDAGLDGGVDAAVAPASPASCGCRTHGAPRRDGLAGVLALLVLTLPRKRRKSASPSPACAPEFPRRLVLRR